MHRLYFFNRNPKMKKHLTTILLILIGFVTVSSATAQSVTLRLQPKQGETHTIVTKANMTTKIDYQGQAMNMSQVLESKQSFTVKTVSSQQCDIESQIEAIKMSSSLFDMEFEIDTEHPEKNDPMSKELAEAIQEVKKPVTITFDAMGNFVEDNNDLNQLGNIIIQLPKQELTVGSKWSSKSTQDVDNIKMVVNMEYTVTAISKKSVDISFTGNIDSKDATGTYNGTASIDPQTGMIVKSTTKLSASYTINEQGLTVPATFTRTITINVR